ncbi:secondary thiamine-phosphate synthase enzyme YjbQ [[Eubacterium] cellulosolvens]
MIFKTSEHFLKTRRNFELIDITDLVKKKVSDSQITNGIVTVYTSHTTCAVEINELEKSLLDDYEVFLEKVAPFEGEYGHNRTCLDGRLNTHSHLRSLFMNTSETIPIQEKKLLLGRWQTIFFVELDGPRDERRFYIHILGE